MESKGKHSTSKLDDSEIAKMLMELRTRFIWGTNAIAADEMDALLDAFINKCKKDYTLMEEAIACFGRGKN